MGPSRTCYAVWVRRSPDCPFQWRADAASREWAEVLASPHIQAGYEVKIAPAVVFA